MRNHRTVGHRSAPLRKIRGLSLIELMIALVLGLVVVGAAGGVFLANRQVYAATETLNRVQENGRISFELIARDLREAGGSPCGAPFDVESVFVNMLQRNTGDWTHSLFVGGIRGIEGGDRDSVDVMLNSEGSVRNIVSATNAAAVIEVDDVSGIEEGDLVIACNSEKAILFEVRGTPADKKLRFNGGRNCSSTLLGVDAGINCADAGNGRNYAACFTGGNCGAYSADQYKDAAGNLVYPPAHIVEAGGIRWHVADNDRGSTSLYRARLNTAAAGWNIVNRGEEIAEGVSRLRLRYRLRSAPALGFQAANLIAPGQWPDVAAVEVALTTVGVAGVHSANDVRGTDNQPLERTFTYVVALRSREGGA
jgi:type IV pilus assembly protein PilW